MIEKYLQRLSRKGEGGRENWEAPQLSGDSQETRWKNCLVQGDSCRRQGGVIIIIIIIHVVDADIRITCDAYICCRVGVMCMLMTDASSFAGFPGWCVIGDRYVKLSQPMIVCASYLLHGDTLREMVEKKKKENRLS